MMVVNPSVLVPAKTYADFLAYITALAVGGSTPWDTLGVPAGIVRSTPISTTSVLRGSPWLARVGFANSNMAGVAQHSAPTQAVFDAIVAGGFECLFEIAASTGTTVALDRNGLLSTAGSSATGRTVSKFVYWDGSSAWEMNPSTGTGPTPYPIP